MTGLYKAERTFLNYYALMPLSNDQYAKTHRVSICIGAVALAFVTLGTYPFTLGLCMSLEYLIGRITQNGDNLSDIIFRVFQFFRQSLTTKPTTPIIPINQQIDQLADTIDQLVSSKQKSLKVSTQSATTYQQDNDLSKFPSDIQNLIMSKTGADLNQLKLSNREYRKKTESAPFLGFLRDLKELKDFLKSKDELLQEINAQFNQSLDKSLVFKKTDELTNLLLEQLTEQEINELISLPGFSSDFKDLLYINKKIKKINEIGTELITSMQGYLNSIGKMIRFLCEKEMFIKAFDQINIMSTFPPTRVWCLNMIYKKSMEKNQFAAAFKVLKELSETDYNFDRADFLVFIEKLCSENQFGFALKVISKSKLEVVQETLPVLLGKLCDLGLFVEAKCAADLIILTQEKKYLLRQDSYLIIATKLCEQQRTSEVLELQREYATKESNTHGQEHFLSQIIRILAENNEYDAAKDLVNLLPDKALRRNAINHICAGYMKNKREHEDTWTFGAWQAGRC